jgi:hypothetical protein
LALTVPVATGIDELQAWPATGRSNRAHYGPMYGSQPLASITVDSGPWVANCTHWVSIANDGTWQHDLNTFK